MIIHKAHVKRPRRTCRIFFFFYFILKLYETRPLKSTWLLLERVARFKLETKELIRIQLFKEPVTWGNQCHAYQSQLKSSFKHITNHIRRSQARMLCRIIQLEIHGKVLEIYENLSRNNMVMNWHWCQHRQD